MEKTYVIAHDLKSYLSHLSDHHPYQISIDPSAFNEVKEFLSVHKDESSLYYKAYVTIFFTDSYGAFKTKELPSLDRLKSEVKKDPYYFFLLGFYYLAIHDFDTKKLAYKYLWKAYKANCLPTSKYLKLAKPELDLSKIEALELANENPLTMYSRGLKLYYKDHIESFKLIKRASELGYPPAILKMSDFYRLGKVVSKDYTKSLELMKASVSYPYDETILKMAYAYYQGIITPKDIKHALVYLNFIPLKSKTYGRAAFLLGHIYESGMLGEPDLAKAFTYYEEGSRRLPHSYSTFKLATFYHYGIVVEPQLSRAYELYESISSRCPFAYLELGKMCQDGEGCNRDYHKAFLYFKKAAKYGLSRAYSELGRCYYEGLGIALDRTKALELFEKSVVSHDALGHYYLGLFYETGIFYPLDLAKAEEHYTLGAKGGNQNAHYALIAILTKDDKH